MASIAPAAPKRVSHHRLRRRDRELVGVVAEDVLDRLRLGEIAQRRRRAVRVDVADALGLDACAAERGAHHVGDAGGLGLGLRHVVRVVRGAVAEHLRVDRGRRVPARPRAPPGRSTHAPSPITNPARVASNGRDARGGSSFSTASPRIAREAGEDQRVHARLAAAGEHRVGVAALDQLGGLADRVRAGRARGDDGVVRARDARARSRAGRSPSRRGRSAGSSARRGRGRARGGPPPAPGSRSRRRSRCRRRSPPASGRSRSAPRRRAPPCAAPSGEQDVPLELAHLLRRGDLRSASKSFTSAAILTGTSLASKERIQSMPLSPATAARQVEGASLPSGVTAPSPVTATLLIV